MAARKAWADWSLMNAYDGAVNQQLSEDVKISTDVVSNGQLGCVQLYFVPIVLCAGRVWDRSASALRGWSTKAWRLLFSGVFPKERCKFGCDYDGGTGSCVGHERCGGGRGCLEEFTRRCFQWFWKERGVRSEFVYWFYERERETSEHPNVARCRGTTTRDSRRVRGWSTIKEGAREGSSECHECGEFGLAMNSREASAFEVSKRGLAETRCVGMVSVDVNAQEIGAVLLLEREIPKFRVESNRVPR